MFIDALSSFEASDWSREYHLPEPVLRTCTALRRLEVSYSNEEGGLGEIAVLPDAISALGQLQNLTLVSRLRVVSPSLGSCRHLTKLSLGSIDLPDDDPDALLPAALSQLTALRILRLMLTGVTSAALGAVVRGTTRLESLFLAQVPVSSIPDALAELTTLRDMQIYNAPLTALACGPYLSNLTWVAADRLSPRRPANCCAPPGHQTEGFGH